MFWDTILRSWVRWSCYFIFALIITPRKRYSCTRSTSVFSVVTQSWRELSWCIWRVAIIMLFCFSRWLIIIGQVIGCRSSDRKNLNLGPFGFINTFMNWVIKKVLKKGGGGGGRRERERERGREREREGQRERETDTDRHRQWRRNRERERGDFKVLKLLTNNFVF